jgi:hypothetical protein
MHFLRGLDQHVGKRGMQIRPGDELDGGRDHGQRLWRRIFSEVERARRQLELGEVAKAAHVGVALREIEQANTARVEQLAHGRRARGVAHEKHRVGLAREERVLGSFAFEIEEPCASAGFDATRLEQRLRAGRSPNGLSNTCPRRCHSEMLKSGSTTIIGRPPLKISIAADPKRLWKRRS